MNRTKAHKVTELSQGQLSKPALTWTFTERNENSIETFLIISLMYGCI